MLRSFIGLCLAVFLFNCCEGPRVRDVTVIADLDPMLWRSDSGSTLPIRLEEPMEEFTVFIRTGLDRGTHPLTLNAVLVGADTTELTLVTSYDEGKKAGIGYREYSFPLNIHADTGLWTLSIRPDRDVSGVSAVGLKAGKK